MTSDADNHFNHLLGILTSSRKLRVVFACLLVAPVLAVATYFAYEAMPQDYTLRVSGGELIDNRHFLVKALQEEAAGRGLNIEIVGTRGAFEAMDAVDRGDIDLAFVQGGLDFKRFGHARHVATLNAEQLHILARESIKTISDLKGKVINLGSKSEGTRIIAKKVLAFSGLDDSSDYGETNLSAEDIFTRKPSNLPDAFAVVSYAPSFLVEFLVKDRGYRLLEVPFPESLALREGWVAEGSLLAYTYSVEPPVPPIDLKTVGVRLHVVANEYVSDRAISRVLETIFSPNYEARVGMKLNESHLTEPSGLDFSLGTLAFLMRNDPVISAESWATIQSAVGAAMGLVSSILLMLKWFKGQESKKLTSDEEFKGFIAAVLKIEEQLTNGARTKGVLRSSLIEAQRQLSDLKTEALKRYPTALFEDPGLFDRLIAAIEDTRMDIVIHHLELSGSVGGFYQGPLVANNETPSSGVRAA